MDASMLYKVNQAEKNLFAHTKAHAGWHGRQKELTMLDTEHRTQVLCKDCYDPFPVARFRLGYDTCLDCGDKQAHAVTYCTAPINKSNYMLITNYAELAQLNPKRTA